MQKIVLAVLVVGAALAACSGIETDPGDTARFEATGFSRYAWRSEALDTGGHSRDLLSRADPTIRASVEERLAELGYRRVATEDAQFVIEYIAAGSINDGRLATSASNVTPYPVATINRQVDGATVDNAYALSGVKEMGNLLLVFVDKTSRDVLWRVRISKVIDDANRVNERALRAAIRQGLATLPDAS